MSEFRDWLRHYRVNFSRLHGDFAHFGKGRQYPTHVFNYLQKYINGQIIAAGFIKEPSRCGPAKVKSVFVLSGTGLQSSPMPVHCRLVSSVRCGPYLPTNTSFENAS